MTPMDDQRQRVHTRGLHGMGNPDGIRDSRTVGWNGSPVRNHVRDGTGTGKDLMGRDGNGIYFLD